MKPFIPLPRKENTTSGSTWRLSMGKSYGQSTHRLQWETRTVGTNSPSGASPEMRVHFTILHDENNGEVLE